MMKPTKTMYRYVCVNEKCKRVCTLTIGTINGTENDTVPDGCVMRIYKPHWYVIEDKNNEVDGE